MNMTQLLSGKVIDRVMTDGSRLILILEGGTQIARIIWKDDEPSLEGIDARIVIPGAELNSATPYFGKGH